MADEQRIFVELLSSADVARLEARDEELRLELKRVEEKMEGLHRTIYELMDVISKLRTRR